MESRGSNRASTLRRPLVVSVIYPRNLNWGTLQVFLVPLQNGMTQLLNNDLKVLISLEFKLKWWVLSRNGFSTKDYFFLLRIGTVIMALLPQIQKQSHQWPPEHTCGPCLGRPKPHQLQKSFSSTMPQQPLLELRDLKAYWHNNEMCWGMVRYLQKVVPHL